MTDDLVGRQFGEYRLESLLGKGGMARVYRAVDTGTNRHVVVKLIDPPFRSDPEYVARFQREAQAIAKLNHPNIIQLYRFAEQDGLLYMAMQHVDGADLEVVLAGYRADNAFMEPDDASRIVREICSALDYAHGRGVIHRDVKPANILLDKEGQAFLTDFGLALLTEVGTRGEIFGSAHYMSPEQAISSAQAVPQSDLYSMGVILFEMFTGNVPFDADKPLDIALLHMSEPPPSPRDLRSEINPELNAMILKILAKKPEDRYATGRELVDALDHSLMGRPALASSSTLKHQTIPERVSLNLAQGSLPPIPSEVAAAKPQPAVEPIPADKPPGTESEPPNSGKTTSKYTLPIVGLAALFLMAFICLAVIALPPLINRINLTSVASDSESSIANATQSAIPRVEATITPPVIGAETDTAETASPVILSSLPPPTETAVIYSILFVRGPGGDSIVLINRSGAVFPLTNLRIDGDKNKDLNGSAWRVTSLDSGACVGAWKESGKNTKTELPNGVNCTLTGKELTLKNKDWFGEDKFDVYYNDTLIGTCGKNANNCAVTFPP